MKTKEELLELKNKEFIFACLDILKTMSNVDYISVLTNPDECKRRFDMYYPVLQEVPILGSIAREYVTDTTGHRRYYPNTFTVNGRRFVVCNDWYYVTKANRRDTRTDFVNWIFRSIK